MAERIREDLRETSEHVRSFVLGTAVGTLFALANRYGIRCNRATRERLRANREARRERLRANREARRAAAVMAEQLRYRTMN